MEEQIKEDNDIELLGGDRMDFEKHEKKNIKDFIKMMHSRFRSGRKQYGMDYLMKDQIKDIEEELVDVAVYAMLLFNKVRMMKCLK